MPLDELKDITSEKLESAAAYSAINLISYDPAAPQDGLNAATKSMNVAWQMRDEGVLAESFGGPYAYATFKDEKQMHDVANSLSLAGIGVLKGENGLIVTGEELKEVTPHKLGLVEAYEKKEISDPSFTAPISINIDNEKPPVLKRSNP